MANLDFTPLYRSTVGFDRVPTLLHAATKLAGANETYPPYNIEKSGDVVLSSVSSFTPQW